MRRTSKITWRCHACGAQVSVPRRRTPVAVRVIEPGGQQTRIVTVKGAVVHECRVGPSILDGQLVLVLP